MMRRVVMSSQPEALPLQLEAIGTNPDQETVYRPNGYPIFHWLQTTEGEGELTINEMTWRMTEHNGVLLAPHIPHRYEAKSANWQTCYITFQGSMAAALLESFRFNQAERFQWHAGNQRITQHFEDMLQFAESAADPSGWQSSAQLYSLLALLRTDASTDNRPSMSKRMERMQHLLDWIENEYTNPDLGLREMATRLGIGERQLNERFRELFGLTAYAYLIQLRLRKAKEWLPSRPDWTVTRIGLAVGFRDTSHFVAMFRQKEGMTPHTYRKLHGDGMQE
jgi:AraC-like DNA-binding protein